MKKLILALGFTGALFVASPASAADCTFSTPQVADPACSNETDSGAVDPNANGSSGGGNVQVQSAAPAVAPAARSQLPVTGVETASIALAGLAMVAGGAVMVTRTKKDEASA